MARPDLATTEKFLQSLRQRGKARWAVDVIIRSGGEAVMTFNGQYGAYRPEKRLEITSDGQEPA